MSDLTKQEFEEKPPKGRCPFPGCGAIFTVEEGKPGACRKHRDLIRDVLFILDHVKIQPLKPGTEEPEGPAFYVPKPGMAQEAIKQAADAAEGGKHVRRD